MTLPNLNTKIILPVIKRVMPNVIAHSIIGVAPMTAPIDPYFIVEHYGDTEFKLLRSWHDDNSEYDEFMLWLTTECHWKYKIKLNFVMRLATKEDRLIFNELDGAMYCKLKWVK